MYLNLFVLEILDLSSKKWSNSTKRFFLSKGFLSSFEKYHQNLKFIYAYFDSGIFHGQVFNLNFQKVNNYAKRNMISNKLFGYFLSIFNLKVFTVGNTFLTNINFSDFSNLKITNQFFQNIIITINRLHNVNWFIFPDHFFKELDLVDPKKILPELIKIEVEEDMHLPLKNEWKSYSDYHLSLKKKYKKRQNLVWKKSHLIDVRKLSPSDLEYNQNRIQELFDNIKNKSSFNPVIFNIKTFEDLIFLKDKFNIYGYFIEKKLIAFSSEFYDNELLYSYFVGLDYNYNKSYNLYERILLETIKHAIEKSVKKIVFGRTAAEFKSNVGAIPIRSYIYLYIRNSLIRAIISPFLKKIKPKKWTQRKPFKKILL